MFDFILTAAFALAALLLIIVTVHDWRGTKRVGYVLPALAFVLAGVLIIADPMMMGIPWLAGIVWLLNRDCAACYRAWSFTTANVACRYAYRRPSD